MPLSANGLLHYPLDIDLSGGRAIYPPFEQLGPVQ